jgi:hypothetical protein
VIVEAGGILHHQHPRLGGNAPEGRRVMGLE